ncbi:16S rRNA (guanine(966)-N(2))-methyltransferase RsmD [Leptothrix discophora]|uniref:16S rRNA (Guanine(966)-N(2))-methyltransferase RsmD n=1 Tax=Leptothrix discophora TaxID=89 RepID=A0ABT9G4D3_LEPDI|nr:16S rRNA (guanine(966)-N(2))-methyltransferase RsmD [Leptothrix discophora]MDP4301341.1 16S rRNA (guanine(966)-N(2))-methyltransferase RsmD [Leptothrix discophora]
MPSSTRSSTRSATRPPQRPAQRPAPAARPAGEVRLIGGQWKRSKLAVPDRPGLRPTPDRVRETLYNWLGQDLSGWQVVDAYAGSGALGYEAASRGAAKVVLIEQDNVLVQSLAAAAQRLGAQDRVQVVRADALAWLRGQPAQAWDLVLLDPPFGLGLDGPALQAARRVVRDDGYLYLESGQPLDEAGAAALGLRLHRNGRAGMVHFHLLTPLPVAFAKVEPQ